MGTSATVLVKYQGKEYASFNAYDGSTSTVTAYVAATICACGIGSVREAFLNAPIILEESEERNMLERQAKATDAFFQACAQKGREAFGAGWFLDYLFQYGRPGFSHGGVIELFAESLEQNGSADEADFVLDLDRGVFLEMDYLERQEPIFELDLMRVQLYQPQQMWEAFDGFVSNVAEGEDWTLARRQMAWSAAIEQAFHHASENQGQGPDSTALPYRFSLAGMASLRGAQRCAYSFTLEAGEEHILKGVALFLQQIDGHFSQAGVLSFKPNPSGLMLIARPEPQWNDLIENLARELRPVLLHHESVDQHGYGKVATRSSTCGGCSVGVSFEAEEGETGAGAWLTSGLLEEQTSLSMLGLAAMDGPFAERVGPPLCLRQDWSIAMLTMAFAHARDHAQGKGASRQAFAQLSEFQQQCLHRLLGPVLKQYFPLTSA